MSSGAIDNNDIRPNKQPYTNNYIKISYWKMGSSTWQNTASIKRQCTLFNFVTQEEGTTEHVNCDQCDCDSDSDCDSDVNCFEQGNSDPLTSNSQALAKPLYVGIL